MHRYLRIEVHFLFTLGNQRTRVTCKSCETWSASQRFTRDLCLFIALCILANFWECWGGGVMTPTLDCCWGHIARLPFPHTFVLFKTILKHICLIHRILNEMETSHLHQYYLYLDKNKDIFMYCVLVLFVVLLNLRQGHIVLKSSLFSIIWQCLGLWGGG